MPQNRWEDEDGVRHASRSNCLLRLKASRVMVSQSDLKTCGGTVRMVHVALLLRYCGVEAKDKRIDVTGCIRLFYLNFIIFIVLGSKGILVFWLGL
jgi:hypothetical protein